MKVHCYNCRKDLSKWNVGRDGRMVLCDDCVARLLGCVPDSVNKQERKEIVRAKLTDDKRLKKIKGV